MATARWPCLGRGWGPVGFAIRFHFSMGAAMMTVDHIIFSYRAIVQHHQSHYPRLRRCRGCYRRCHRRVASRARCSADLRGRPPPLSQKPRPVFVRRDGRRRRGPDDGANTLQSARTRVKPAASSSRVALEAARPDSNLSGGAVKRRELLPRALGFDQRTARRDVSRSGDRQRRGPFRSFVARAKRLPGFRSARKAAGRERARGAPRLAATRTVCPSGAQHVHTYGEATRTVCVPARGRVYAYMPVFTYARCLRSPTTWTLEPRLSDAPRPGRIRARGRDASRSYRDDRARAYEILEINRRRRRRSRGWTGRRGRGGLERFYVHARAILVLSPASSPTAAVPSRGETCVKTNEKRRGKISL